MDDLLERYLNDHLAGASGALLLIQQVADNHDVDSARVFFLQLKDQVEADRFLLEDLLKRLGKDPSAFHQAAGRFAARFSSIKLMWEEIEPSKLGFIESLEILQLGVQGKLLLWTALGQIAPEFPEWQDIDFSELKLRALQQLDDIEFRRLRAVKITLLDAERRLLSFA